MIDTSTTFIRARGLHSELQLTNYYRLEGVLLMILYMIIALAAWFYPPDDPATVNKRSLHFRGGLIR